MRKILVALLLAMLPTAGMSPYADATVAKAAALPVPEERSVVTHHTLTLDGRRLRYTATAGNLLLRNDKNQVIGSMFYVAYTADGVKNPVRRPLTFLFNGGPGSSSIWLHMGAFGPVRVETADAQATPPAPYRIVSNHYSLLDRSDLVFIDAMGTGFSRLAGAGAPKDFYGTDADIASFGKFIERYLSVNNRWNSPKFLLGESYGTTRAAGLVDWLQQHGIACNGVILQSSYLNAYVDFPGPPLSLDLPYELYLPTMAATAWYHSKLPHQPADLAAFLQQVRRFALGDYARALDRGDRLTPAETQTIAQRLHDYTGLPVKFLLETRLRVTPGRFEKELLRADDRITGRLDARFLGFDRDRVGERPSYDPSDAAISGAFTAAFNWYLRNDLDYRTSRTYLVTDYPAVGKHWNNGQRLDGQEWPLMDVAENLRDAMMKNPNLKVFSANGYFDFATPFFETEYDLDHMGLPAALRKNITYGYYESGHMIYLHLAALAAYRADLARFYTSATRQ